MKEEKCLLGKYESYDRNGNVDKNINKNTDMNGSRDRKSDLTD